MFKHHREIVHNHGNDYLDWLFYQNLFLRPGFHYTTNATTTTQKQSDYKVEQSSFTLIALF